MFKTHAQKNADHGQPDTSLLWFVTLFAAITYVMLSTRAILSPFEVKHFVDAKRILSVLAGAWLLWVAVNAATVAQGHGPRAQIVAVLRVSVPGILGIFATRELYDLAVSGELAQRLSLNIRWMLSFLGYFAAAVATYFALSYHRLLQSAQASALPNSLRAGTADNGLDRQEIVNLLISLRAQTGYETADLEFTPDAVMLQQRLMQIDRTLVELNRTIAD